MRVRPLLARQRVGPHRIHSQVLRDAGRAYGDLLAVEPLVLPYKPGWLSAAPDRWKRLRLHQDLSKLSRRQRRDAAVLPLRAHRHVLQLHMGRPGRHHSHPGRHIGLLHNAWEGTLRMSHFADWRPAKGTSVCRMKLAARIFDLCTMNRLRSRVGWDHHQRGAKENYRLAKSFAIHRRLKILWCSVTPSRSRRPCQAGCGEVSIYHGPLDRAYSTMRCIVTWRLGEMLHSVRCDARSRWSLLLRGWLYPSRRCKVQRRRDLCRLWRKQGSTDNGTSSENGGSSRLFQALPHPPSILDAHMADPAVFVTWKNNDRNGISSRMNVAVPNHAYSQLRRSISCFCSFLESPRS
ncbi:hypothetical protein TOPH_07683 [Tolypocladium ophioglossoides CBS 100239]|uniref:Uncharacterized protein n=1 Tax=Tolypocladium ophioglossoides (strain CBS 100239) TaxID=1163406 RepID=A0A0L0N0Q7_TOLOC|nr:hypothetical protein TOPH_07683 [Tolypocladium ophioglossoides CBS 100239]